MGAIFEERRDSRSFEQYPFLSLFKQKYEFTIQSAHRSTRPTELRLRHNNPSLLITHYGLRKKVRNLRNYGVTTQHIRNLACRNYITLLRISIRNHRNYAVTTALRSGISNAGATQSGRRWARDASDRRSTCTCRYGPFRNSDRNVLWMVGVFWYGGMNDWVWRAG